LGQPPWVWRGHLPRVACLAAYLLLGTSRSCSTLRLIPGGCLPLTPSFSQTLPSTLGPAAASRSYPPRLRYSQTLRPCASTSAQHLPDSLAEALPHRLARVPRVMCRSITTSGSPVPHGVCSSPSPGVVTNVKYAATVTFATVSAHRLRGPPGGLGRPRLRTSSRALPYFRWNCPAGNPAHAGVSAPEQLPHASLNRSP